MVDEKELVRLIQEFLQQQYEGGRWLDRAQEIAKTCLGERNSHKPGSRYYPYYQILINLSCAFIRESKDWGDFFKRLNAPFDVFQQGKDNSDLTYRANPEVKKTVAEVLIKLLSKGLPTGKNWRLFSIYLPVHLGITAEKKAAPAQYVEEEVPTEELVPVKRGWIFKREVIEKRIVMKKVKKRIPAKQGISKTAEELIKELAQFA